MPNKQEATKQKPTILHIHLGLSDIWHTTEQHYLFRVELAWRHEGLQIKWIIIVSYNFTKWNKQFALLYTVIGAPPRTFGS